MAQVSNMYCSIQHPILRFRKRKLLKDTSWSIKFQMQAIIDCGLLKFMEKTTWMEARLAREALTLARTVSKRDKNLIIDSVQR